MSKTNKTDAAPSAAAVFKTIDNKLNAPGGECSTALDRLEQMSWFLILHYLDEQEKEREAVAELSGEPYAPILPENCAGARGFGRPSRTARLISTRRSRACSKTDR